MTLAERQKSYEKTFDQVLMTRLPIIIRLDGKGFSKLTKKLDKPYSLDFANIMANALLYTITDIQGAIFGFTASDEVNFVLRNDQTFETEPWLNNRVQKMISIITSTFTLAFYKHSLIAELEFPTDPIFDGRAFLVPSVSEAVNNLIWRQNDCYKYALMEAGHYEFSRKMGAHDAFHLLKGKDFEQRKEMLKHYCGLEFEEYYPRSFYQGVGVYKVPTLLKGKDETLTQNKWSLDWNLPMFQEEYDFLYNIIMHGKDVPKI